MTDGQTQSRSKRLEQVELEDSETQVAAIPEMMDNTVAEISDSVTNFNITLPPRTRCLPKRYRDILPETLAPPPANVARTVEPVQARRVILNVWEHVTTPRNIFGLYREYWGRPTYVPDTEIVVQEAFNSESPSTQLPPEFFPFENISQFLLSNWYLDTSSGQRSGPDLDRLIKEVILHPQFNPEDLRGFSHRKMKVILDAIDMSKDPTTSSIFHTQDGWIRDASVVIRIPEGKKAWTTPLGREFLIRGLHYRPIVAIIQKVYSTSRNIHFTPFELWHEVEGCHTRQRVFGELFSSPAFIEEYKTLPREPGCTLERTVAPLMFSSDSTHLASFGTAKLWPIYMFFGSQSKLA